MVELGAGQNSKPKNYGVGRVTNIKHGKAACLEAMRGLDRFDWGSPSLATIDPASQEKEVKETIYKDECRARAR